MKTFYPIPMEYKYEFHLLPRDNFIIETHLSLEEVYLLLDSLIETKLHVDMRKIFYGRLESRSFQILSVASVYRNGIFRPILRGEILPGAQGAQLRVTSRPSQFHFGFLMLWLSLGTSVALGSLASLLPCQSMEAALSELFSSLLLEAFLLFVGWVLPSAFFWLDESRIKALLIERFRNH